MNGNKSECPTCKELMWSANKGRLMICLNPDCLVEDDIRNEKNSVKNKKSALVAQQDKAANF